MGGLGRRQRRPGGLTAGRDWPSLLLLAGQGVSVLGDGLAALAIPLLVLGLTRNPLVSALSAASVTVGYLLVGLPTGVLVDRLDPWRVLIAIDAARMVLFARLYALSLAGALGIWLILTVAMSAGACSVLSQSAMTLAVKDLFAVTGLMAANSALELASQVSVVAGPAIVGLLAVTGQIGLALLTDALTFAVSLASLVTVMRCSPVSGGPGGPGPQSLAGGSSPPASGRACITCSWSGSCLSSPRPGGWAAGLRSAARPDSRPGRTDRTDQARSPGAGPGQARRTGG